MRQSVSCIERDAAPAYQLRYGRKRGDKLNTYILPGLDWAGLLEIVVRDALPGDVIEVHTAEMEELAVRALQHVNRDDLTVVLTAPRVRRPPGGPPDAAQDAAGSTT